MSKIVLTRNVPVYSLVGADGVRPTGGYRARGEFIPIGRLTDVVYNGRTRLALPLTGDQKGKFLLAEDLNEALEELGSQWSSAYWHAGHAATEREREIAREDAHGCKEEAVELIEALAPQLRAVT